MKTLNILTFVLASSTISLAQKAEYFVSANTNVINPSSYISANVYEQITDNTLPTKEYVFGIGIERRSRIVYSRTDIEHGMYSQTNKEIFRQHGFSNYQMIRMGIGVNFFNEENGFVLSAGINMGGMREKTAAKTYFEKDYSVRLKKIHEAEDIYMQESKTSFYGSSGLDLNVEAPITERINLQWRNNLFAYRNRDSFLIEGGNFNSMLGISYKII